MKYIIALIMLFRVLFVWADAADSLKTAGIKAFKAEDYPRAIMLMQEAEKLNQQDAEIYYYLGWFTHYNAYDSRPMAGYSDSLSVLVWSYLDKAVALKPDYGDAKYFYGAECSASSFSAMKRGDIVKLKESYKKAYDWGAYPPWLMEFGRNMLNSCDSNAILFTGGNADYDVCMYLQLHENVRQDISIVPLSMLERPWYMQFLKTGLPNAFLPLNVNLTDEQIMDMHPYKWDDTAVEIQVPTALAEKYQMASPAMSILIKPDLVSGRFSQKIGGDISRERTLLSTQNAMLLQIIESNAFLRPVMFTRFCDTAMQAGFDGYLQNCGLVSRLLPVPVMEESKLSRDIVAMESLLKPEKLVSFQDITQLDIPRISFITAAYANLLLDLYNLALQDNQITKAKRLMGFYKQYLMPGLDTATEEQYLAAMEYYLKTDFSKDDSASN